MRRKETLSPPAALASMLLATALLMGPDPLPADDDRAAHGTFTGEVKPVLYVADVEQSAPFFRDVFGFELLGYAGAEEDPYYADLAAGDLKFGLHEPTAPGQEERIGQQR